MRIVGAIALVLCSIALLAGLGGYKKTGADGFQPFGPARTGASSRFITSAMNAGSVIIASEVKLDRMPGLAGGAWPIIALKNHNAPPDFSGPELAKAFAYNSSEISPPNQR